MACARSWDERLAAEGSDFEKLFKSASLRKHLLSLFSDSLP